MPLVEQYFRMRQQGPHSSTHAVHRGEGLRQTDDGWIRTETPSGSFRDGPDHSKSRRHFCFCPQQICTRYTHRRIWL